MSLLGFQKALAALVTDPELRARILVDPHAALSGHDLSPRECRRLAEMAGQRGMAVNSMLYRANRLTPLHQHLPRTCSVLGQNLRRILDGFWTVHRKTPLQFADEIARFAHFVGERLTAGDLENPLLPEVLDFEFAACQLRFLQRRRTTAALRAAASTVAPETGDPARVVHPLVRIVRFRHDPGLVLQVTDEIPAPDCDLPEGEHYVLLDARGEDLRIACIEARFGWVLKEAEAGRGLEAAGETAEMLARAGLLVAA